MSMNKWNADNIQHINENKTWKVLIHADIFWPGHFLSNWYKKCTVFGKYQSDIDKHISFFLTHLFWNLRIYISAWWKIQSFNMQKKRERRMKKKMKFYIWKHDYIMYKQKSLLINQCLFPSNPTIPIFWHVYTTNCSQNTWFSLKRSPVYQFWRRMIHKKHGYS